MTGGRVLARNTALNLVGQLLPAAVAVGTIPILVRGYGAERFAVLTLAWAAIGYFSLFDLGLGRALTQAVAHRLGSGSHDELPAVAWSAVLLLFGLGGVGAAAVSASAPYVVRHVVNVPPALQRETILAFWILAISLPLVVTTAGLRGIMEAHQHFGMVTLLRAPMILFMFFGPLVALAFSNSLVPAVSMLALGRVVGFALHITVCLRRYPYFGNGVVLRGAPVLPLLRFGGWTTITNIVSPMMVVMDRFLVGALLPLAAVAHYVTPYEVVVKLLIVPVALLGAFFPVFASTVTVDRARMARLYETSLRVVVLITFPIVLVTVAFAREALQLWIGPLLPPESARVMQWLAVGVFVNGIAQTPLSALQSAARPDLIAKLHLLELPVYVVSILLLVHAFGLQGVAIAWTLRVTLDALALLALSWRWLGLAAPTGARGSGLVLAMLVTFGIAGGGGLATQARVLYVVAVLSAFVPVSWWWLLTADERESMRRWTKRPVVSAAAGPDGIV